MQIQRRQLAPREIDHELIWLLVSLGAFAGLAICLLAHLPMPRCVFHSLTGLPCLTCGATRSAWQFMHGHLVVSFLFNPLAFLAYCGIATFDLYAFGVLLSRGRRFRLVGLAPKEKRFVRLGAVVLLSANWCYLLVAHIV